MDRTVSLLWALRYSKLDYLKYVLKKQKILPLWDAFELRPIALSGNYRILKFYHENIRCISGGSLIDEAASIGHLNLVKWLDFIGSTASTLAMDWASEKGHLQVLKWLHKNREEGCTYLGLRFAVKNGHFEVVEYLLENQLGGINFKLVRSALDRNHLDILQLLLKHQKLSERERLKLKDIARLGRKDLALNCLSASFGM